MKPKKLLALSLSIGFGVILGFVSGEYIHLRSVVTQSQGAYLNLFFKVFTWSLVPWGLIGLMIGLASPDPKSALKFGAVYGFTLSLAFTWGGYDPLFFFIPLLLALFGAACGAALGFLGNLMRFKRV